MRVLVVAIAHLEFELTAERAVSASLADAVSKGYMRGKESREEVLFRPDEWWGEQNIELLTRTSVTAVDPGEHVAKLSTGAPLSWK